MLLMSFKSHTTIVRDDSFRVRATPPVEFDRYDSEILFFELFYDFSIGRDDQITVVDMRTRLLGLSNIMASYPRKTLWRDSNT